MEERELGRSGVRVSRVVLGCGNFGGIGSAPELFGHGESEADAFAIMDAAWEAGMSTFDTADAYGGGRSETAIGRWLATKGPEVRDRIVLSTKTFNPMDAGADHGLAPERIRRQLDSSLARLGVERVDLYLAHEWDRDVPVAVTLGAFDELVSAGKIRVAGASNVSAAQLEEALSAAEQHGVRRYEWVQNEYSLLAREAEADILPLCEREGLGFTPFSPLSGGWLTGKYRRGEPPPAGSRMTQRPDPYLHLQRDETFDALDALAEAAAEHGTDSATLALAWLLARPGVDAVIVGPRRPEHLEPALRALDLDLAPTELHALADPFAWASAS